MKAIKIFIASFLIIALSALVYSFTVSSTTKAVEPKEEKSKINKQVRVRYCINLSCADQNEDRSRVLVPSNYNQPCAIECGEAACVCAIMAFEGTNGLPVIDEDEDPELYNQLNDYVDNGVWNSPSLLIDKKNL